MLSGSSHRVAAFGGLSFTAVVVRGGLGRGAGRK